MAERKPRKAPLNHEPEAVAWALERSGLTKQEVARRMGVEPSLVTEIAKGTRNCTQANLIKLADILNLPLVMLERKRGPQRLEGVAAMTPQVTPRAEAMPRQPPGSTGHSATCTSLNCPAGRRRSPSGPPA